MRPKSNDKVHHKSRLFSLHTPNAKPDGIPVCFLLHFWPFCRHTLEDLLAMLFLQRVVPHSLCDALIGFIFCTEFCSHCCAPDQHFAEHSELKGVAKKSCNKSGKME